MEILQKVAEKARGICLDDQFISLFLLCQEEDAEQKVYKYLEQYRLAEIRKTNEKISEKWEKKAKRLIDNVISIPQEEKAALLDFFTKYRFVIQDYWNDEKKLTTFLQEKEVLSWKEQIMELRTYFEIPSSRIIKLSSRLQGESH